MILLKSELKAKGCFPTALNFLFQCQMPCAEIAQTRRQGSSPAGSAPGKAVGASAPQPHARASLFSQCNLTSKTQWQKHRVINYRYKPAEVGKCSIDSKQGPSVLFNIWDMIFLFLMPIWHQRNSREGNTEEQRLLKACMPFGMAGLVVWVCIFTASLCSLDVANTLFMIFNLVSMCSTSSCGAPGGPAAVEKQGHLQRSKQTNAIRINRRTVIGYSLLLLGSNYLSKLVREKIQHPQHR